MILTERMSNLADSNKEIIIYGEYEIGLPATIFEIANSFECFIYRGQSDISYGLAPTVERGLGNKAADVYEKDIIKEFMRRVKNYISNPPKDENTLEWLALIQHYGGPTRLLDFTHSIYVAVFFALASNLSNCNNKKTASVWAINTILLRKFLREKIEDKGFNDKNKYLNKVIYVGNNKNIPKAAFFAEPFEMNNRLFAQQGLFLIPTNLEYGFEENLFSTFNSSSEVKASVECKHIFDFKNVKDDFGSTCIVKINIPYTNQLLLLGALHKMNINYSTIYPDIEGLARSLYDIENKRFSRSTLIKSY